MKILNKKGFFSKSLFCFFVATNPITNTMIAGIIKNKLDLLEVTKINYYPDKNRLELIFTDESYFYIATKKEWVEDLVTDIKSGNSKILYIEESSVEK